MRIKTIYDALLEKIDEAETIEDIKDILRIMARIDKINLMANAGGKEDKEYRLFTRAKITAFESYDDSEGVWCKMATKEIWDSWGRDLPEERKARPATQIEWDKFFDGGDQK